MEFVLKRRMFRAEDHLRWLLLGLPVYIYIVAAWMIQPLSLSNIALAYALPMYFLVGMLFFQVPKPELLTMLRRVRMELGLVLLIGVLSILSIVNSSEPFKVFRILFPSILPVLLFFQLMALRAVSAKALERLPRVFLVVGIILSCVPFMLSFVSDGLHLYVFHIGYRFKGFFENANQYAVMVAVLIPLITCEIAVSQKRVSRWLWTGLLVLFFYLLARSGSKTSLFITFGYLWIFYIIVHWKFQSLLKNIFLVSMIGVLMIGLAIYGIPLAIAIDPIFGAKLEAVFSGGIQNYSTMESRGLLWNEAWRQGTEHWLIGTGAGEPIRTQTEATNHAHNLILDYFRGIGIFGAFAIILLCARILWRAVRKALELSLARMASRADMRIFACYASAAVYVLCNQLSNSFGPATISALWLLYLPAVLSESKAGSSIAVASRLTQVSRASPE
ncbi:MAG: O-antigen ligase family protein [Gammaproteobacteria bacterium]|jgi:O-antigen ligase|nr:O-antigen ligase family protein [Chromatiales bacterium]MDH3987688.1 O-antigen ligase family protein [Gammaproteobacteria bacterium]